ncbi:MAG TPA: cell division FtsA domain-containing protein [Candidatus Limnocylindrales bacterium]|nr:cell division FtsA domain-containing protein [Candidatus Limnocylindrales bacterium]
MSAFNLAKTVPIYFEIGQSTLRVLQGDQGLELPLERLPGGRLSSGCKENLILSLKSFFKRDRWKGSARAFCAISARGVSLRHITLPSASKDLHRLLLLQIESEFPLSPDELAWGYLPVNPGKAPGNGSPAQQEYLIAAVKKEVIEEYTELLSACSVTPVFTVAALARQDLCPKTTRPQALLDVGRFYSELILFANNVPTSIRVLPWGGETITRAIETKLGISRAEAEELKLKRAQGPLNDVGTEQKVQAAIEEALDALARAANGYVLGEKVYLTGQSARLKELGPSLTRRLTSGIVCETLEPAVAVGKSAAIQGLQISADPGNGRRPLIIQGKPTNGSTREVRTAPWQWVALAGSLALAILALPYLEAVALKPYLAGKLTALKADRRKLAMIDAEWGFFQHLKQNAPPYLDALFLLAKAAPPGARFDSLSMNRRGDLSLRASMQNSQQVADFRSKLIDSGFFANLTVEEQTPSPDRQKLTVRMSAQWKPLNARQALAFGPTAEEIEKAKTRKREPQMGGPMPPMMGGPMMPGPMPPDQGGPGPARPRPARVNPTGGALPPEALPPGAMPPGALPPGAVPPGAVPPSQPPPTNP